MYFGVYKGFTQGNIPCLFRLHEDVDLQKLKESIEKLIDIHYELKATIYKDEQGQYKNYRHDEQPKEYSFFEYALEQNKNYLPDYLAERNYHNILINGITIRGNPFVRRNAYNNESKSYNDGRFTGSYKRINVEKFENFCKEKFVTENLVFLMTEAHAHNIYERCLYIFNSNVTIIYLQIINCNSISKFSYSIKNIKNINNNNEIK
ncbi:hypothetical protein PIROE2DRAFT_14547 [Piromyces sp. E2]|nr:hypothetical protein PIROE2DRAFT_14547 [Piromyces sp. E2]|eukprot:OUM59846.1 hypothetical protein PIROE2DRAFT_14547 [Piromyces sp. E2]